MTRPSSSSEKPPQPRQAVFCFLSATTLPQGDGSYIVRPGRPTAELTPRQASASLGVSPSAIYRMVEDGTLESRRPLRKKILISAESLERHRERTRDPEFWVLAHGHH